MRILIGVDGSSQGLNGDRLVATLPLSPADEVIVASAVDRSALLEAWGCASTDAAPCSTLFAAHRAAPGTQA